MCIRHRFNDSKRDKKKKCKFEKGWNLESNKKSFVIKKNKSSMEKFVVNFKKIYSLF